MKVKTNNKRLLFILVFSLLVYGSANAFWSEVFNVRPITLKIVDKDTDEPLANVPVYYVVMSHYHIRFFLIFPILDPILKERFEVVEKHFSNEQGEIIIDGRQIRLSRCKSEEIEELIFVNLEKIKQSGNDEKFVSLYGGVVSDLYPGVTNPVTDYRGFFIRSSTDHENRILSNKMATAVWNGGSLLKEKEEFTIQLERKTQPIHPSDAAEPRR